MERGVTFNTHLYWFLNYLYVHNYLYTYETNNHKMPTKMLKW